MMHTICKYADNTENLKIFKNYGFRGRGLKYKKIINLIKNKICKINYKIIFYK